MQKFGGEIKVRFWYWKPAGPRSHSAGVSIRLSRHDNYEFKSFAQWIYEDYSKAVEDGIIEGLREAGYAPDLGILITLEGVEEDPIHSSEHDFYKAAKCAMQSDVVNSKNTQSY